LAPGPKPTELVELGETRRQPGEPFSRPAALRRAGPEPNRERQRGLGRLAADRSSLLDRPRIRSDHRCRRARTRRRGSRCREVEQLGSHTPPERCERGPRAAAATAAQRPSLLPRLCTRAPGERREDELSRRDLARRVPLQRREHLRRRIAAMLGPERQPHRASRTQDAACPATRLLAALDSRREPLHARPADRCLERSHDLGREYAGATELRLEPLPFGGNRERNPGRSAAEPWVK